MSGGLHQAQLLLPYLKALPEWESFGKMMDLGGGPGGLLPGFCFGASPDEGGCFRPKGGHR